METPGPVNPELVFSLRRVTERAATAAFSWIGRGDSQDAGRAALDAMRAALADVDIDAVVAVAPRGAMLNPGPAFYMEKFVASAPARGKIDPRWPVEKKLSILAEVLSKDVSDLTVFVLEKPRHRELVDRILASGARVALYQAGDVAGALMAAIPGSGIDALMGTGGTPEGVMSACAIRGIGGEFLARLDPQLQTEAKAVKEAGIDTSKWYQRDEIITSDTVFFCATGITTGLMLEGVERTKSQ